MKRTLSRSDLLHFPLLTLVLCTSALAVQTDAFVADTVYFGSVPIYAIDSGDLLPARPGPEIAILTSDGHVLVVIPGAVPWPTRVAVFDDDPSYGLGDRPTVAVGELDSFAPGEEIASMSAQHLNIARGWANGTWSVERIFDAEGQVGNAWGARIGDYRPSQAAEEVFLIYEGVLDFSTGTVF